MLSTGHQKVILQSDQEPSIIVVKHKAGAHIPTEIVYEEKPSQRQQRQRGALKRAIQTIQGTDPCDQGLHRNDRSVQRLVSTAQSLKWLVRPCSMDFDDISTLAVTGRQRTNASEVNHLSNRLQRSVSKSCSKPHKTAGPLQKLAVNWMDGCWLGFQHEGLENTS